MFCLIEPIREFDDVWKYFACGFTWCIIERILWNAVENLDHWIYDPGKEPVITVVYGDDQNVVSGDVATFESTLNNFLAFSESCLREERIQNFVLTALLGNS